MDLNQLYFNHQVLAMRTAEIPDSVVRHDSEFVASTIAGRIGCIQRALGARAASGWELLALPDRDDLTGRSFGLACTRPGSTGHDLAISGRELAGATADAGPVEPSENPDRGHAGVAERTEASPFQPIRSGSAERSNASWLIDDRPRRQAVVNPTITHAQFRAPRKVIHHEQEQRPAGRQKLGAGAAAGSAGRSP